MRTSLRSIIDEQVEKLTERERRQYTDGDDFYYDHTPEFTRTKRDEWRDFEKYGKYPFIIKCIVIFLHVYLLIAIARYAYGIYAFNPRFFLTLPEAALLCIVPPAVWVWSTMYDYWNFYRQKMYFYRFCIILAGAAAAEILAKVSFPLTARIVAIFPVNQNITIEMLLNLGRFLQIAFSLIIPAIGCIWLIHLSEDEDFKQSVLYFKVSRGQDWRKNKDFAYDLNIIQRLDTGEPYTIKEKDRFLHTFCDGTTGTGKTSTILVKAFAQDLDQRQHNENWQKKVCLNMVKSGAFSIIRPFSDKDFTINNFAPVMEKGPGADQINQKRLEDYNYLKYVSQVATLVCIAPNEDLADECYEMALKRGAKVHRIDPVLQEGRHKPGFTGFNFFMIPSWLEGKALETEITTKANIFSDILQALYDLNGSKDAYFTSLNQTITVAICKLLMLTFQKRNGRPPNAGDIQACIDDFSLCKPYFEDLKRDYNINGKISANRSDRVANDSQKVNCGVWQDVYTRINNDLLGQNATQINLQATGLRNQIDLFINHPLIRDVFCNENSIDLDAALENGEVIIVNYAMELGAAVSKGFGLSFLLAYKQACFRRPGNENTRTAAFLTVDELPVLLHPGLKEFITLGRQYKNASLFAYQTLDQFDETSSTRFLKGVIMTNCATQILYGRAGVTEMDLYEKLAGKEASLDRQDSISQTSLTAETPTYNYGSRYTRKLANKVEGYEIRYRDFLEVTVFTVDAGSPVPPFFGKVSFLETANRKGRPRLVVDWGKYCKEPARQVQERTEHAFPFSRTGYIRTQESAPAEKLVFSASGIQTREGAEGADDAAAGVGRKAPASPPPSAIDKVGQVRARSELAEPDEDDTEQQEEGSQEYLTLLDLAMQGDTES